MLQNNYVRLWDSFNPTFQEKVDLQFLLWYANENFEQTISFHGHEQKRLSKTSQNSNRRRVIEAANPGG